MSKQKIGVIHPGVMGICVAATIQNSGHEVYWVSDGRSPQSRKRAEDYGLGDAESLATLCRTCSVIVSVCPPHAAEEVAEQVLANSFGGIYLDVNAISPQRAIRIGQLMTRAEVDFVDGGIIGFPVWERGKTWLYLSGKRAPDAVNFFVGGPLETSVVGDEIGKASALKMCYAAYTKGTTALLCGILATAQAMGVRGELETQWSRDWADFGTQAGERVRNVTAKAWRFAGEMAEIAATFRAAGLPGEFHAAAEMIYQRIAGFKDAPTTPALEEVLEKLVQTSEEEDR
jgi:3-hydroxyisobutyrate dehydrogenase-like beta-hydroxyacid dehydrogenase